jgi:hypothetical protein
VDFVFIFLNAISSVYILSFQIKLLEVDFHVIHRMLPDLEEIVHTYFGSYKNDSHLSSALYLRIYTSSSNPYIFNANCTIIPFMSKATEA